MKIEIKTTFNDLVAPKELSNHHDILSLTTRR